MKKCCVSQLILGGTQPLFLSSIIWSDYIVVYITQYGRKVIVVVYNVVHNSKL